MAAHTLRRTNNNTQHHCTHQCDGFNHTLWMKWLPAERWQIFIGQLVSGVWHRLLLSMQQPSPRKKKAFDLCTAEMLLHGTSGWDTAWLNFDCMVT